MKSILIILSIISLSAFGQMNLIPNNGFETLSSCPFTSNQVPNATGWLTPHGSPDLFSACTGTSNQVGVPRNVTGYQCPSNGTNYAGFICFFQPNDDNQEILGIKLTDSLIIGTKYYVSFKLVLADWKGQYSDASSNMGLKLTTKPFPYMGEFAPIPNVIVNNFAHVYTNQMVTDTLNWTTIKGSVVADSNYKYVYFGQFFLKSNVTYTVLYGPPTAAYYMIDDVCLSTDSNTCKITSTGCISTSLQEIEMENSIYISPNPTSDFLKINGLKSKARFRLTNILGQLFLDGEISENDKIQVSSLPPDLYFIELKTVRQTKTLKVLIRR
jgi:hypothetical protein